MTSINHINGILRQLVFHEIETFGPLAPQSLLAVLAGLTGFTSSPVCLRTVGASEFHSAIGLHLEELLGSDRVCYITSATESGIVGLGAQDKVRVIVYEFTTTDMSTLSPLDRLIRRKPIRTLDAPLGNDIRIRTFDRPVCVILLDAGAIDNAIAPRHLLTVKLQDSSGLLPLQIDRRLALLTPGAKKNRWRRNLRCARLAKTLTRLNCTITLKAPDISPEMMQHIGDAGDGERLRQVLALAGVVTFLMEFTRKATVPMEVCVSVEAVNFVIQLIELAGVIDENASLADAPQQTLDELRSMFKPPDVPSLGPYKPGASLDHDPNTPVTRDPSAFTVKQLHLRASHANIDESTIHGRLKVLVNRGFIEPLPQKRGKEHQWRLTAQGFASQQTALSTLLRRLCPSSASGKSEATPLMDALKTGHSPVGQLRQHRPTSAPGAPRIDSPPEASASPQNGNFGAKSDSHADGCVGRREGVSKSY